MNAEYSSETVNTVHYPGTGVWYIDKKTGQKKEKKRRVVHRRLFLTSLPGVKLSGSRNLRVVSTKRGYSLSERKETARPWWEKDATGKPLPPHVADDYTRTKHSGNGRVEPLMTATELRTFLTFKLGSDDTALSAITALDFGEPLEGDERWTALSRYGYEKPEYEDDEEVAVAA